ncbi:DUF4189 domain-containing protein [Burkholderia ubonensis]|uniref:DUF4189 domain-containing protein n=1 Tax=Burkholderia ubonensis TaxID=101571 RepID=UPI000BA73FD1|nr:DUF4189 domain-containing protein [Burkholderia ubonensis]PAJ96076.1 hypothetical protein CJO69_03270 [Burkholderia ubonensis]RQP73494.1 DUF4189 domain-containing protein [Burkholderia ubonensis]
MTLRKQRIVLIAWLCVFTTQASAWVVAAHGDNGFAFVARDAASSEEATRAALDGCGKESGGCRLVGKPVAGPNALVIARSDDGISVSTDRNPESAAERAMKDCKATFKRHCRLDLASWDSGERWYAVTMGKGGAYVEYGSESPEQAKAGALEGCRKRTSQPETCEVKTSNDASVWIAVAESKTTSSWVIDDTKDGALGRAQTACEQLKKGESCDKKAAVFNTGPVAVPASFEQVQRRISQQRDTSTPHDAPANAGTVTRYSDSCRNADCIRRYENGRSVRYTACLNPATALPMNDPMRIGGCGGADSRGNLFGAGAM